MHPRLQELLLMDFAGNATFREVIAAYVWTAPAFFLPPTSPHLRAHVAVVVAVPHPDGRLLHALAGV
jgi:hypothetical protein